MMFYLALVYFPLFCVDAFAPSSFPKVSLMELAARRSFISGNWKLNPQTRDEAVQLASDIAQSVTANPDRDVALFVPYVFIESAMNVVENKLMVGAEVRAETPHDRSISSLFLF
jgi:Triosephosphate isomerase